MRNNHAKWRADITQGKWISNLIKGEAGNILFKFVMNSWYWYWNLEDNLIDYCLTDYFFAEAYEHLPTVRQQIDRCPYSQGHILNLQPLLNSVYNEKKWNELTSDTNVFKLSYKMELKEENLVGEKTFYGFISGNE